MALLDFIAKAIHGWESDGCGQPPRIEERLPAELGPSEDRANLMGQAVREASAPHFVRPFEAAAASSNSQW